MNARDDTVLIVTVAGAAVGLYYLGKKLLDKTTDTIADPLAKAVIAMTMAPPASPLGNVVFPDGSYVPVNQLDQGQMKWVGDTLTLTYNGRKYSLASHDSNGNYPATPQ